MADGETTNETSGLVGGGGCHWVIGGWCRGQKKTPTSHKNSLEAVVGSVVGAENTNESSRLVGGDGGG